MGNTSSKGPFSISILVYRRVTWTFRLEFRNLKHQHPKFMRQKFEQMDQHLQGVRSLPPTFAAMVKPKNHWWNGSFLLGPRKSKYQTLPLGSRESFIWIIPKTILCLVLDFQGGDMLIEPGKKRRHENHILSSMKSWLVWMQGILRC